jgi:hypothetical protein
LAEQRGVSELFFRVDWEVRLGKYMKKQGGFFHSDYIVYEVETRGLGWVVWRRYSDFEWLHDYLVKEWPLCIIPPVAEKKLTQNLEVSLVERRENFLQHFMDRICRHPELKSSAAFKAFLSATDSADSHKEWDKCKTIMDNTHTPDFDFRSRFDDDGKKLFEGKQKLTIKDFHSLSTTADSEVNLPYKDYLKQIEAYVATSGPLDCKLKCLSKKLMKEIQTIERTTKEIAKCFDEKYEAIRKFNVNVSFNKFQELGKLPQLN